MQSANLPTLPQTKEIEITLKMRINSYFQYFNFLISYVLPGNNLTEHLLDFQNQFSNPYALTPRDLEKLLNKFNVFLTAIKTELMKIIKINYAHDPEFIEKMRDALRRVIFDLYFSVSKITPLKELMSGGTPNFYDEEAEKYYRVMSINNGYSSCHPDTLRYLLEQLDESPEEREKMLTEDRLASIQIYEFIYQLNEQQKNREAERERQLQQLKAQQAEEMRLNAIRENLKRLDDAVKAQGQCRGKENNPKAHANLSSIRNQSLWVNHTNKKETNKKKPDPRLSIGFILNK